MARAVALVVVVLFLVSPAHALRCGNQLVSEGDRKIEVLAACGEPTWKDVWTEERTHRVLRDKDSGTVLDERRRSGEVEDWVYNFGPQQFLHVLRFRSGILTGIDSAGHGFTPRPVVNPGVECWSEGMAFDRTKYQMLHYCGEPTTQDVRYVERSRARFGPGQGDITQRQVTVRVDDWTYNFGPHRLMYVFRFENGRVVNVESAGYGY